MLNSWICWIQNTLQVVLQCLFFFTLTQNLLCGTYKTTTTKIWAKLSEPKHTGIKSSLHRSPDTWHRSLARTVVSFLFCGTIPIFFKMGLLDMDFLDDVRRMNPRQVNNHGLKRCQLISRQYEMHGFNEALFSLTYAGSPRFLWAVFENGFLIEPGNIWCRLITRNFNGSHFQIS